MTPRKAITDRMKWQSCLFWAELRCPECDVILNPEDDIEWDHAHALAFDGPHHHANIRPMHTNCHTQKTIRDVKALAQIPQASLSRLSETDGEQDMSEEPGAHLLRHAFRLPHPG